jgi:hypothetical protein
MRSVSGACSSAHSICMRSLCSMRMHTGMHYQEDSCVATHESQHSQLELLTVRKAASLRCACRLEPHKLEGSNEPM